MGDIEGWAQPHGVMPNGLLPEEANFVFYPIDSERWSKAEERTAQLIDCIQPSQPSDERRNAVAVYVQRLITKCFPCQVFTFGSVPLKTYLPDGDIDLTAFSEYQNMDLWANQVRDTLENEEKDENAEFRVKEVQYIQAEVKLIKCLVENIVVDISFNQLGGLCTLCFLEEVDILINQNHLFKRSIILIKAWCYYESRLLGAHHGLISTYALETLVLYIFHVFNNSFAGPLEVLYRFLEFFSKFDWGNFCVSLWGPIPLASLPAMTAKPPRKDSGELLLSKPFLDACNTVYAVFPGGQESLGQPFVSKHFNVIDPLRINNNLGRSVSKGNFYRIRGAFAYGAKRLATLLKSPKEELYNEVNEFFTNTWDRHSIGSRPDASSNNLLRLRLLPNPDHIENPETVDNKSVSKIINKKLFGRHTEIETNHVSSQYSTNYTEKRQRRLVARTYSSPELTDTLSGTSSQGRCNRVAGRGKIHISAAGLDAIRKNLGSEIFAIQNNIKSVIDDPSSQSKSIQNSYDDDSDSVSVIEDPSFTIGTLGMLQEEQDRVNMMASASAPGFNRQVHMPTDFAPPHFRLPLSQSILASMGYPYRNFSFPFIRNPWGNMQFSPGLIHSPMTQYFSGMRMTSDPENFIHTDSGKYGSVILSTEDTDNGFWQELDDGSTSGPDMDSGGLEMIRSDDQREDRWPAKENLWSTRKDRLNFSQHPENRGNEAYLDERIAISEKNPTVRTTSSSKTSSESSWDGTSTKESKASKVNRGLKTATPIMSSSAHGKGKTAPEHLSYHGDQSERDSMNELTERSNGPHMHVLGHPIKNSEPAETSVSDSVGPGSRHRAMDNLTFYPTGPPVPFITMLPYYNYPTDNNDSGQSNDSSVVASIKAPEEHKSDILHSDFRRHYQNLLYGRFYQNPQYYRSMVYPSPVSVTPMYLQGRKPWDSPGRPSSTNMTPFNQIMSYGSRFVPVAPLQAVPNRPSGAYQRYGDEMPRYRSGTGTYLPNHKASARDRHPTGTRRGNYSYDRGEHHGDRNDREGSWNINSKASSSGRCHSQSQTERSNGPFHLNSSQHDSLNASYGMYPTGVSSNGHSVMMLYPYDQHSSCGARAEQVELGSLGPGNFSGINDVTHLSEGSRESGVFEEQRFNNSSVYRSSPDQPSSPVIQRRL